MAGFLSSVALRLYNVIEIRPLQGFFMPKADNQTKYMMAITLVDKQSQQIK